MGYWSSIDAKFEVEENLHSDNSFTYPPSIWELNNIFKQSDFLNMPFGGEGIPEINISNAYGTKLTITVSCRDESVSDKDIIDWWYKQITWLQATKAKLVIKPDWTLSKLVLKHKCKVRNYEIFDEEKEESC